MSRASKSLKTIRTTESEKNQSVKRKLRDFVEPSVVSKTAMIDLFYDRVTNDDGKDGDKGGSCLEETNSKKDTAREREILRLHNPALLETIEMSEYERANDEFRSKSESRKRALEKLKRRYVSPDFGRRIFEACVAERSYRVLKRVAEKQPRLPVSGHNNSHPVYNTVVGLYIDESTYERYLANQLLPPIFKYTDRLYKYPRGIVWSYVLVTVLREFNRDAMLLVNGKRTTFKAEVLKYVSAKFVDRVGVLSDIAPPTVEGPDREAKFLSKLIKLAINSVWLCAVNFVAETPVTVTRFDSAAASVYLNSSLKPLVKIVHSTLFYDNRSGYWLYKTAKGRAYFDRIESILADVASQ